MEKKAEKYELMLQQAAGLLEMEKDWIATLANLSALIKTSEPATLFAGFYLYNGHDLTLGPFQGGVSCTRITLGKGVCGEVAETGRPIIVSDVTKHRNYIACDSRARSEIVLPMIKDGELFGVLDLDAAQKGVYDETDQQYLEKIVQMLLADHSPQVL